MTPDAIASRIQALKAHRAKLANEVRKLEVAIIIADGQIKETEQYWARVVADNKDDAIVCTAAQLKALGHSFDGDFIRMTDGSAWTRDGDVWRYHAVPVEPPADVAQEAA